MKNSKGIAIILIVFAFYLKLGKGNSILEKMKNSRGKKKNEGELCAWQSCMACWPCGLNIFLKLKNKIREIKMENP